VGPPVLGPQLTILAPDIDDRINAANDVVLRVKIDGHDGGWRWSLDEPLDGEGEVGGGMGAGDLRALVSDVRPGRSHTLFVALVDASGHALSPAITRRVDFTVGQSGAPRLANTLIAYASEVTGDSDIWVARPDGSGEVNLTHNPAADSEPTWSSDGRQLAFISDRAGARDVYIMTADGSDVRRLATGGSARHPRWSPDGSRIAYLHVGDGADVGPGHVVGVDDPSIDGVLNTWRTATFAWSPDGSRIAGVTGRVRATVGRAYIMDAHGGNVFEVDRIEPETISPRGPSWYSPPIWTPDGSTLIFARLDRESDGFAPSVTATRVSPDGVVREDGFMRRMPVALAPDGVHIVGHLPYSPGDSAYFEVGQVDGDTLYGFRESNRPEVSWAPDSSAFVIHAEYPVIISVDGSTRTRLADPQGTQHAWQPFPTPSPEPYPILTVDSPAPGRTYPATTTAIDLNIRMEYYDGPWQWRLNSPFPHEGPGGGNRVPNGTVARVEGLAPGRTHTVYVAPVSASGDLLQPAFHNSSTFRLAAPDPSLALGDTVIAYVSSRGGGIRVAAPDGSDTRTVTPDGPMYRDLSWAPDGMRLAYSSDETGNYDIYTMRADGSDVVQLTTDATDDVDAAWSPDGTRIAFTSERDGHRDIYAINPDGTNVTRLVSTGSGTQYPAWSPDGTRLAVGLGPRNFLPRHLAIVDLATRSIRTLYSGFGAGYPAWDPTGESLLYVRESRYERRTLHTIQPDGENDRPLPLGEDADQPTWAPDGSTIAYRKRDGIYIAAADGGDPARLAGTDKWSHSPAWSPPLPDVGAVALPAGPQLLVMTTLPDALSVNGVAVDVSDGALSASELAGVGATLCLRRTDGRLEGIAATNGQVLAGADFDLTPGAEIVVNFPTPVELLHVGGGLASPSAADPASDAPWAFAAVVRVADDGRLPGGSFLRVGVRDEHVDMSPASQSRVTSGSRLVAFANPSRAPAPGVREVVRVQLIGPQGGGLATLTSHRITRDEALNAVAIVDVSTRPAATRLLPNYPNPFNPETWIPFELREASNVSITLYDARGSAVRTLRLGGRLAGFHVGRADAGYWDGRNDLGEPVSSGVYYYEFRAGTHRSLRRLMIGR
jgi:TolB protein